MKLLITLVIVGVFCTIASNAFLFKHKFKDGCDPNPCEHKSKCILNAKNANISTCECPEGYTGNHCQFKTGCYSKPCKKGSCENLKENATLFHCTCDKGYVGEKCEHADACLKHACTNGSICHLDAKYKPICDCPNGFIGKKCDKRNCTIVEFKGHKNFASKQKMFVDSEVLKKWTDLDSLAHLCEVKIQPIRTYSQQANISARVEYKDYPFYTGRGLDFEVNDKDGKLLCNKICLGKNPIPMKGAKCFIDGLLAIGWKYSVLYPGVINDGSHMYTEGASLKAYHKIREFKQIGCKETKF